MGKIAELIAECDESISFYTEHLAKLRRFIDNIEQCSELLRSVNPTIKLNEFEETIQFTNFNALLSITAIDLSVVTKNIFLANMDWERIFFIKHAYLLIFESLKKLRPNSGTPYVEQRLFSKYKSIAPEYIICTNRIDEFKKRQEFKKIENTRNCVAGHIDKSFKKYYRTITNLDGQEAAILIRDFVLIIKNLMEVTQLYSSTSLQNALKRSEQMDKKIESLINQLQQLIVNK